MADLSNHDTTQVVTETEENVVDVKSESNNRLTSDTAPNIAIMHKKEYGINSENSDTLQKDKNTEDGENVVKVKGELNNQSIGLDSALRHEKDFMSNSGSNDTTQADRDTDGKVVNIKNGSSNQSISDIAPNLVIKVEKESVVEPVSSDDHGSDGDEPAPKKRRIAASEFLQLSDPHSTHTPIYTYTTPISATGKNESVSTLPSDPSCRNRNETSSSRIPDEDLSNLVRRYTLSCS